MRHRCRYTGYPPRLSGSAVFLLWLVTTAASGCGIVSYKTGSTAGDYQAAQDRCHKEGRSKGPDFERCMEEQGWIVKQLGATAAASAPKESAPAESLPPEVQAAPAAPSLPKNGAPAEPPPPEVQSTPGAGDVAPSPKRSDTPSAEHPIVVKNWFKLGGTAGELAAAKERCATKLGAAAHPEPESDVVSSEMIDCLRNEGWHAF